MTDPAPEPKPQKKDGGETVGKLASESDHIFQAPDCAVERVTVYRDRAEVCRKLQARLRKGVNEINLRGLPSVIEEDSIRVEGKGQATIAEVFFRTRHVDEPKQEAGAELQELKRQRKELQERKEEIAARRNIISQQRGILDKFVQSSTNLTKQEEGSGHLNDDYFKGIKGFLALYGSEAQQLETARFSLERDEEAVAHKLEAVLRNLAEITHKRNECVTSVRECTVVLEADAEGAVELSVSYVVTRASWTPSYDIRMYTSDGRMKIQYYGQIRQSTGEAWREAKIFLSTAEPSVGGVVPALATLQLSLRKAPPPTAQRSMPAPPISSRRRGMSRDDYDTFANESACELPERPPPPPPMALTQAKVEESTTSTTYEIARPSTIPSDNSDHRVTVGLIDVAPLLQYLSVPRMAAQAFLQARVTNSSPFTLLPGPSSIFLDNAFVAKAELKAVTPQEEFECSLGVDPSVRVTYKPLKKYNATVGLLSKTSSITHEQVTEIKNLHNYKIKLVMRDQLPYSTEDKIKVSLLEPALDVKHPEKTRGVRLTKAHHLEWELELEKQQSREVLLKYVVELPKGEELASREVSSPS